MWDLRFPRTIGRWHLPARRPEPLVGLLIALAAIGMAADVQSLVQRLWADIRRDTVVRRAIEHGVAISMNAIERQTPPGGRLPAINLLGVTVDRRRDDWILFGELDSHSQGLPVDAIAVALRAIRLNLEPPGIDIRPQPTSTESPAPEQGVRYFGGVAHTVVGDWFFQFDYWMKRVSMDQEAADVPGIPIYWRRAVSRLEREVEMCTSIGRGTELRRNRYWLCAGEFKATEDDDTLVFQDAPLHVLAEGGPDAGRAAVAGSPCASRGTDDPLASEFAGALDKHLGTLSERVPVQEIQQFAKTLAALEWLTEQDPSRSLQRWLDGPLLPVDTPTTVPTLIKSATREHQSSGGLHRHELQLSGGVVISPTLKLARPAGAWLSNLRWTVAEARPFRQAAVWPFAFPQNP